ncbi:MAG: hypothetical protein AB9879_13075 [Methanothrix sp.]
MLAPATSNVPDISDPISASTIIKFDSVEPPDPALTEKLMPSTPEIAKNKANTSVGINSCNRMFASSLIAYTLR